MDMNQAGAELLQVIKSGLVESGKAIQTQFPILCEQILRWGIVNNICTIILSIFIMATSYGLTRYGIKKQKLDENCDGELWLFLIIPSLIVVIIFMILFWCSLFEICKVVSAPNLYILDYLKGLVAPNK